MCLLFAESRKHNSHLFKLISGSEQKIAGGLRRFICWFCFCFAFFHVQWILISPYMPEALYKYLFNE